MSKVFIPIKLILFLSLISICLSFGVISHKFTKNPLDSGDKRFNNALSLFTRKIIEKKGGPRNAKVVPVAAFRNFDNGINYKLLAAITDLHTHKTEFVESDVSSSSSDIVNSADSDDYDEKYFSFSEYDEDTTDITYLKPGKLFNEIKGFLYNELETQKIYIVKVNSILSTYKIDNYTCYYVVDMVVESGGKTYTKNIIVSLGDGKDFEVLHSFDFPL